MTNGYMDEMQQGYQIAAGLLAEVKKVVVGKDYEISMLITALLSGTHVLIEDVPGTGKTTLASTLAKAAGMRFNRVQFTPDVMASDITGFNLYNREKEAFVFKEGSIMCNVLLADEINRASPKTQSSLLEAMEERSVTVDGKTYDLPRPFFVIATQNPTGYVGTYPLPEAQIDRFGMKLSMGYPTPEAEVSILKNRLLQNPLQTVNPVCNADTIYRISQLINNVRIEDSVLQYIVMLVTATRQHPAVELGASPRAAVALMRIARAYAFMHHRAYVVPEDIAELFPQTIAHRILLSQEARMARMDAITVINEVLASVRAPIRSKR